MLILRDLPSDEELSALAKRYSDLEPEAIAALLAFIRASCEIFHFSDGHFARHGTSCGRFAVLALLNRQPDGLVTPSRIAEACGVTRATITGLLDGLEKDRLIRRTRGAGDRRTMQVQLTAGGRRFLDGMLPDHFRRMARLMSGIGSRDRQTLRRLSATITANATALSADTPKRTR